MPQKQQGFGSYIGFGGGKTSLSDRIRGNPQITLVSLTSAGMQKAKMYGVEGKKGDILCYLAKSAPASVGEISMGTQIDVRTVQNILHECAASKPPLVTVGGGN
jgi:hypothetical protein